MNVIIICLDTLRWDALGCYNPGWVQTPAIDAFAQRATRFDSAFCGSFPTIPMRVDAYTGNVNWPRYGWKGIDPEQPKLPRLLGQQGYHTGLVLDTANNVRAGLHTYYDNYRWIKKDVADDLRREDVDVSVPLENLRQSGQGYLSDRVITSHFCKETDWFGVRTMLAACEWLETHAEKEPFFLWVDTFEIHEIWNPPAHYVNLYSSDYTGLDYAYPNYGYTTIYSQEELERMRARYAGEVTLTDRWVGHLLRQIELQGLYETTTVILLSDHGMYLGEHGRAGKHTVDPNDPWPLYDEVARLPLLIWTPFDVAPRQVSALVQPADILPTVLDLCGLESPPSVGKSWVPLLKGEADVLHDAVFSSCHSGTGPGRIAFLPSLISVTTPEYTGILGPKEHASELYDRIGDPAQTRNIADEHPGEVERMKGLLAEFMQRQGADESYVSTYALAR